MAPRKSAGKQQQKLTFSLANRHLCRDSDIGYCVKTQDRKEYPDETVPNKRKSECNRQARYQREWNPMPPRPCFAAELQHVSDPESVGKIMSPESRQIGVCEISDHHIRHQQNPSPGNAEPPVEIQIRAAQQPLVEHTNFVEKFSPVATERCRIRPYWFLHARLDVRITRTEPAGEPCGDCLREWTFRPRLDL